MRLSSPSRDTRDSLERLRPSMRRLAVPGRRWLRRPALLTDAPMLSREKLRSPELSLTLLTVARDRLRLSLEMLEMLSMRWPASTPELTLIRDVLRELSTPCRLRLMTCSIRPRTLRKRPRRLWLMLLDLLMSSDLNRITPLPSPRARELLRPPLESLRTVWLMPMMLLCVVASLPWPSLRPESESLRLSLAMSRPALERT